MKVSRRSGRVKMKRLIYGCGLVTVILATAFVEKVLPAQNASVEDAESTAKMYASSKSWIPDQITEDPAGNSLQVVLIGPDAPIGHKVLTMNVDIDHEQRKLFQELLNYSSVRFHYRESPLQGNRFSPAAHLEIIELKGGTQP